MASGAIIVAVGAGLPDLRDPIAALASTHTGVEGTWLGAATRLKCLTNSAIEQYIPEHKRRIAISSTDGRFGSNTAEVIAGQKEYSGYGCGDDFKYLQEDSSGITLSSTPARLARMSHTAREESSYSFVELGNWVFTTMSTEPLPVTCQPGYGKQYALPMASRRLLFSSIPAESELCSWPWCEVRVRSPLASTCGLGPWARQAPRATCAAQPRRTRRRGTRLNVSHRITQ